MVSNLSQFIKAMKAGVTFQIIEHFERPECNGELRKPNIVQTNGMYMKIPNDLEHWMNEANKGKGSWLAFGKASDWSFCNGVIHQSIMGKPLWTIRIIEEGK